MRHPTAHAGLAARHMTSGTYSGPYWVGIMFGVAALALTWRGLPLGAVGGLISILLYEHAYVQAGQSVPPA